ncbi:MAG: response regulator [Treponema sp.]|nr:response regulator [Treponema sp.]
MKTSFWRNFEARIIIIILFITISLPVSIYMMIYYHYHKLTINNLKDDARIVHQYAEDIISEDSFTQLNTIEDESKEIYLTAHKQLDEIRRIANIRYLYTAKQNTNGEYIYVLDGLDFEADDFRHVGDPIEEEIIPDLAKSLNNEIILGDNILNTDWGVVYVTYFPVHNADGDVIGAIGMEFDCENLYKSFNRARLLTILITLLIAIFCTVIAIIILTKVVRHTEDLLDKKDKALISAKDEALKNSNAKSEFLSRMSHEIRTPMNAIIGMTAIAEGTTDSSKIKYCLSTIKTSSAQLLDLINDILDMSKIEAGKFELFMVPLNIENILRKASSLVADKIERKHQSFHLELEEHMQLHYIGDELRISQVITNLLSNAVKFTPENGKVSINVKQLKKEDAYTTLLFSVSDTGIGMTKEHMDKLFISFEQADTSISRKFGGTGLGLAISKTIIEKMNGKIWAESEQDKGSVFYFEIRLQNAAAKDDAVLLSGTNLPDEKNIAAEEAIDQLPDFSDITMLLAEDIDINREIVISLLENTHIKIETAENGKIAVEKFQEAPGRYTLILMDIQMPEMDGYEAAKMIRTLETPHAASIPIIAMTANAFKEDIDKCLACGMNDHLAKPIDPVEVIRKIAQYSRLKQ